MPVQFAVLVEDTGEFGVDGVAHLLAVLQHLVIHGVAVYHRAAQFPDGVQCAGLARAGAAGQAQNDAVAVRLHHVEAGGLFQPVADSQPQSPVVRALGVYLRHGAAVKGPQGIEHPLGLSQLIAAGTQGVDLLSLKQVGVLVKADDAGGGAHTPLDLPGGGVRRAGKHRNRRLGRVVAVLHAGGLGLLTLLQGSGDGLVHVDVADEPFQVLQRQSAGPQQAGRLTGQVQNGGLHAHRAGAAVHHTLNLAVHILQHVLGGGAAGAAGGVGAWGRDGHARLPDNGQGDGVVGAAHGHGVQARGDDIRNHVLPAL